MEPEKTDVTLSADGMAADPPPAEPIAETVPDPIPVEDVTGRLAEEFLTLIDEFPHLADPADLPDGVLDTAAEQGIPLLDAYLRYRWQEEKQVREAARQRALAAQQSAGSLARGADKRDPAPDSFLRAFRAALR